MLTAELVQQADYIFGMTHSHVDTMTMLYPQAAEKTFLLREFDETLDAFEKDISDPIGRLLRGLFKLPGSDRTGHCLDPGLYRAGRGGAGSRRRRSTRPSPLARTTAGQELKRALEAHLQAAGLKVVDVEARRRLDYPDECAEAVAQQVSRQQADFGVLVCATGLGMSIAANKVAGVRAALVYDAATASAGATAQQRQRPVRGGRAGSMRPRQGTSWTPSWQRDFEGGRHRHGVPIMETKIIPMDYRLRSS